MNPSAVCFNAAKDLEGLRLNPYLDSAGVPTDGYGNTHGVIMGVPITQGKADGDLNINLTIAAGIINNAVSYPLTQYQFDALCLFVLNVGAGRPSTVMKNRQVTPGKDGFMFLADGSPSTMLRMLRAGRMADAANEFLKWDKIRDPKTGQLVESDGLRNRRATEQKMFLGY